MNLIKVWSHSLHLFIFYNTFNSKNFKWYHQITLSGFLTLMKMQLINLKIPDINMIKKCYLCLWKHIKDITPYFILNTRYSLSRFHWVYIQRVYAAIKNRFHISVFTELQGVSSFRRFDSSQDNRTVYATLSSCQKL